MGNVIKNISTTAAALGLAFSVAGNSSIVVSGNYAVPNYKLFTDLSKNSENSSIIGYSQNNIYIDKRSSRLERMAKESFGEMRDATKEELGGVDRYIKSISKPTGIDFFSLC